MYYFQSIIVFSFLALVTAELPSDYYCYGEGLVKKNDVCRFFAIVIDAGSTGTRLHLYRFVHNIDPNGVPFQIEQEIFQEVKPGLSSFASNPKAAAQSLAPLLQRATNEIPRDIWEKTPITLKATAGLRLLPGDMADNILDEVKEVIHRSGFYSSTQESVSVMSGSDEGLFSWLTLNLLLDTLYSENSKKPHPPSAKLSVAAFDLGGGSTQLTFWPSDTKILEERPEFEREIDFFGNKIRLFTHSFLGNGLVAARLNVLLQSSSEINQKNNQLTSSCMPSNFQITNWEYALKLWNINGSSDYSFTSCYNSVKTFVDNSNIMPLKQLRGSPIYLFSYFFDRAHNSGLVKDTNGGDFQLWQFKEQAEKACKRSVENLSDEAAPHWLPWQCLDLTYIYSLLHDGYQFDDDQPVVVAKKMKKMEVSWGLGLSYALVNEFKEHEQKIVTTATIGNSSTVVDYLLDMVFSGTNHVLSLFNIIKL